ncbi:hypothetical protein GCM10018781_15040 [Kitasatospora indigofera]|uniref:RNA polymerase sigma-70 region 2 domain-containing protein n=1 Tax=Kitasatospora indigofera TaxID=67307 RepID=A0A919FFG4_9ACTN|nr:hypothetical protein GCM10018781_15040 [Kitasatospora indigofera]
MDEALLRSLTPGVLGILVRRGADFAAAEDAVQDALVEAARVWPSDRPRDPKGWLVTVAWRRFLDATRADAARRRRELLVDEEPPPGPAPAVDDTLQLYFLCAHPSLTPSSAVALTLRAVGGLTTRQIADAYLVPEATMAQRISRAKRTVSGVRFDRPGDVATVLRVLYLVFNEGYSGDVDLAAEAIRLTRRLAAAIDHPEVAGLLALMLLHHARRDSRTARDGSLVPLAEQDRTRWDTGSIAEGVEILQAALARDQLGEFQAQAAVAALHADAPTAEEDRLGADRRVVRRTRPPDRQPGRPAQPRGGRRRGRRTARRAGGARGTGGLLSALPERGTPRPAPHRGGGVPPRARRRPGHSGPALCRGGPGGVEPRRARPPDAPGRPPQHPPRRPPAPLTSRARSAAPRRTPEGAKLTLGVVGAPVLVGGPGAPGTGRWPRCTGPGRQGRRRRAGPAATPAATVTATVTEPG